MLARVDIIVAFKHIMTSLLIFFFWNCLIIERGLICTDEHKATQLHQIAHPETLHHIVLVS